MRGSVACVAVCVALLCVGGLLYAPKDDALGEGDPSNNAQDLWPVSQRLRDFAHTKNLRVKTGTADSSGTMCSPRLSSVLSSAGNNTEQEGLLCRIIVQEASDKWYYYDISAEHRGLVNIVPGVYKDGKFEDAVNRYFDIPWYFLSLDPAGHIQFIRTLLNSCLYRDEVLFQNFVGHFLADASPEQRCGGLAYMDYLLWYVGLQDETWSLVIKNLWKRYAPPSYLTPADYRIKKETELRREAQAEVNRVLEEIVMEAVSRGERNDDVTDILASTAH